MHVLALYTLTTGQLRDTTLLLKYNTDLLPGRCQGS